jgi:3-deoxy-D-arabino-heptulosonate 7-phosphate (DAHP) synthase
MSVMALKSNYERAKVMNKQRNDRILRELDVKEAAVKALDGTKGRGKACKGKSLKAQSVVQIVPKKPKRWVLIVGPCSPALTPTTGQ